MPIHFINGNCVIAVEKSHTVYIMQPVINTLIGEYTRTHTNMRTKAISRNQAHLGHRPAHAWFKYARMKHVGYLTATNIVNLLEPKRYGQRALYQTPLEGKLID